MNQRLALVGSRIFDGSEFRDGAALLVDNGRIGGIANIDSIPFGYSRVQLRDGFLAPGFVDLQVNGGGGVLFNDDLSPEAIAAICAAHLRFGTTAILPTLITDVEEKTGAAIAAVKAAKQTAGCIGLHLEGPHLSMARQGAHDPQLIRPMTANDLLRLTRANLPTLLTTVAPESVTNAQISKLVMAGIIVSLGHSDCDCDLALTAVESGATAVTHLFNTMSGLSHRQPGMVGAALNDGRLWAGLIADGIHVDPVAIKIALRAKQGPGRIFLVSDSMSNIGTSMTKFLLAGRWVHLEGQRLVRANGTLAGANLTMIGAVRFMVEQIGIDLAEALRMASYYPAKVIGREKDFGCFATGTRADILHLSEELELINVWQNGFAVKTGQ